jgi:hypothetical protein
MGLLRLPELRVYLDLPDGTNEDRFQKSAEFGSLIDSIRFASPPLAHQAEAARKAPRAAVPIIRGIRSPACLRDSLSRRNNDH